MNLLSKVADRATQLNDPVLNMLMFDLNLYELPDPTTKEYGELMKRVYEAAEKKIQEERTPPPPALSQK